MRRLFKYIILFIVIIVLLISTLVLMTQTAPFKNWLRHKIVTEINKSINGQLKIRHLGGNLLTHFKITDVLLTSQGDTILYLSQLTINFSPSRLLKSEILVRVIAFDAMDLRLKQLPDSTWNVTNLIITEDKPDTSAPKKFVWRLSFEDIQLNNAGLTIEPLMVSPAIPQKIDGLNFHAALLYDDRGLNVKLRNLKLQARKPQFTINELSFLLFNRGNELSVEQLKLRTDHSRISGNATINFADHSSYKIELFAQQIDFGEITSFIPDFPLRGSPTLALKGYYENDSLGFFTTLQDSQQLFELNGHISALSKKPQYIVTGNIHNLDLAYWLNDPSFSSEINGKFSIIGGGFEPDSTKLKLAANFQNLKLFQNSIEKLSIKAHYQYGNVNGDIHASSNLGRVSVSGKFFDIWGKQNFSLRTKLAGFNIADLISNDELQSDINLTLIADGNHFNPETMSTKVQLNLYPSKIANLTVDTLLAIGDINKGFYAIDTLQLDSPIGFFALSGKGDWQTNNDLRFHVRPGDLEMLKTKLKADNLEVNGSVSGQITGKIDSLNLNATYKLSDVLFNELSADSIEGNFSSFHGSDSIYGRSLMHLKNGLFNNLPLEAADIETEFLENLLITSLNFTQQDSINGQIRALFQVDNTPQLTIPMIALNLKDNEWTGGSDSMKIVFGDSNYNFQNVRFTSGDQFIQINGVLDLNEQEDLILNISNVDLKPFSDLLDKHSLFSGKLDFKTHLQGTAEHPFIEGEFVIRNGKVREFLFQTLDGNFDYKDELLSLKSVVQIDENISLKGTGQLPVNLSLTKQDTILYQTRPIQIELTTTALDMGVLMAFSDQIRTANGSIDCDLNITNTLQKPYLTGSLTVANGTFEIPKYGMNYKDIKLNLELDSTNFSLKNFQLQSSEGAITASGGADIGYTDQSTILTNVNLNINSNNFLAASNKDFEVRFNSKLNLQGDLTNPKFGGSVTVLRSRFYLPAFEGSRTVESKESLPLLVLAQYDSTKPGQLLREKKQRSSSTLVQNLRGNIKINIPRNTWLKGPDMNMEIAGELDLVKSGLNFEMFGSIRIIRGNYTLYGKRFDIKKGNFTFQGGIEFNPVVELEVQHVFRGTDKEKKILNLQITEQILNPTLQFSLNDIKIEETDAISYLLFGRSVDELTHGEKSEIGQQPGMTSSGMIKKLLAGQLAGQITRRLQKKLNLDVIEFKGEKDWRQASIVVGKYITNDLFLSYQREFSMGKTNEVVPEQVALEYEINRLLYLQATKGDDKATGFDLIWKFER